MSVLETSGPTNCGIATYPPGASLGPRTRNDYELVWELEGDAEYYSDDSVTAVLPNSILLCQPGSVDVFKWDRNRLTQHAYVHFNILSLPDDFPPAKEWPVVRVLPEGDILRPMFRHLLTWHESQSEWQGKAIIGLMLNVFITGNLRIDPMESTRWPRPVERACSYLYESIDRNPSVAIPLDELAKAADVTPQHLCRLFKQHLGCSPAQVQRYTRLDYAVGLLGRTNYSISKISEICGYANPFHFSRSFRAAFGRSPSDIRHSIETGSPTPLPRLARRISKLMIEQTYLV